MINIWISLFPKKDSEGVTVPLHELVNSSLLWVVTGVELQLCTLLEIILDWVCTVVLFVEDLIFELIVEKASGHSVDLVVHEVVG